MGDRRWVYSFAQAAGRGRTLLGGKGQSLADMTAFGLPVPPGFIISTEACGAYYGAGGRLPDGLEAEVATHLSELESAAGRRFGDPDNPLLVSVRSGAAISMPGMMDTVLNLGLCDATAAGLARLTGDRRFVLDAYRRLRQMFGNVVDGIEHHRFEEVLERERTRAGARSDSALEPEALQRVIVGYQAIDPSFPQDVREQLLRAIHAVFASWNNERAIVYRRLNRIPDDLGTAVTVQAMVFGNRGADSGTGVVFSRDPSTGEPQLVGEYLPNAQGEDVVAGLRTPLPVERLAETLPAAHAELVRTVRLLEEHYGDMQDVEFTVEGGRLFLLQSRSAKRTARAAVRVAHDLVAEGRCTREEALLRLDAAQVEALQHPTFASGPARPQPLARGLGASPGAAVGEVVFDPDTAERLGRAGRRVVLVRLETSPDDIHGIAQAQGVLTARGGMTCHAAIVTRGMGKPCIVGCEALEVGGGRASLAGRPLQAGDVVSLDGATGEVFAGALPLQEPESGSEFEAVLGWADACRRLRVRANADTPEDAERAFRLGAEGIGLVRTEHMFMAPERLPAVQAMILADDEAERRRCLERLLPMQEADFAGIFAAMQGRPVTIRLLDPPLHEFLPVASDDPDVARRARLLHEVNPMLGHRGVRLAITYPEIYEMQVRAILRAAARTKARPEIMFPLIGSASEMAEMAALTARVAEEAGVGADGYSVGACIEVPRGCLVAGQVARHATFFSFGTNDLTQTCFGFSRDDAEARFLHVYLRRRLLPDNPFETLDVDGVGELIETATQRGRAVREDLKVGICGEQGGDPASIDLCHRLGLDYVSCSPPRVPVARLAAAQAAIRERQLREAAPAG